MSKGCCRPTISQEAKPPVGLEPHLLWLEARRDALYGAIHRYSESCYPVPTEWLAEVLELEKELQGEV
jgi:hypothetical protein